MSTQSSSDGGRVPETSREEEEAADDAAQIHAVALKKRARTFSYSVVVPLWSLLIATFVQHHLLLKSVDKGSLIVTQNGKPDVHLEVALLQICVISTVVAGAITGALLLVAEFLPDDYDPNRYHYLALKLLLLVCGFLVKLNAFLLLLLIDTGNVIMALVVLLAAALYTVLWSKTRQTTFHSDAAGHEPYAEELDRLIDFSKEVVNVAYGGLIGRVFDYFKNFTSDVHRSHLKVFDVLMFFTAVISALALTLDALPPLVQEARDRKLLMRALEWLNIASALTAMAAALALSFGAVGDYAFLLVVPPLALAIWWLEMYFAGEGLPRRLEAGGRGDPRGPAHGAPVSVAVPFMGFGVLFAVILNSSGSGSGSSNNNHAPGVVDLEKVSIWVFSAVFILGLGWRLLEHRPPRAPNLARAARYISRCSHVTVVLATVLLGALVSKTIWDFARDDNGVDLGPPPA